MEYCAYTLDTGVVILDNLQFMTATNPNKFQRDFDRFHLMDVAVEKFRRYVKITIWGVPRPSPSLFL